MRPATCANERGWTEAEVAVCGYCRVSSQDQAEHGLSLPHQREAIARYCAQNKLKLLKVYEDPGRSGASIDRPGLRQLLADAKLRGFKKVIVWRLDRWSRDLYQGLWLSKELLVHGVEVISVSEPLNGADPISKAMRAVVATFAELERETIRDRLWTGRRKRLERGEFAGGSAPYGYRLRNSQLVLDPKEAEAVRFIFKRRDDGLTLKEITKELNARKDFKPRASKTWWPSTVSYILSNRTKTYAGHVRYGDSKPGKHEPIR